MQTALLPTDSRGRPRCQGSIVSPAVPGAIRQCCSTQEHDEHWWAGLVERDGRWEPERQVWPKMSLS